MDSQEAIPIRQVTRAVGIPQDMSASAGVYHQAILTIPSIPRELWGMTHWVYSLGDPAADICMLVWQLVVRGHDQSMRWLR